MFKPKDRWVRRYWGIVAGLAVLWSLAWTIVNNAIRVAHAAGGPIR